MQLTFLASQNELCIYNDRMVHTPGYVYVQGVEGETCEANKTESGLEDGGGEDSAHWGDLNLVMSSGFSQASSSTWSVSTVLPPRVGCLMEEASEL